MLIRVRAVHLVVSRHQGQGLALLQRNPETLQIELMQGAGINDLVHTHPQQFLTVHREMFRARCHPHALDAADHRGRHFARQVGVLREVFEVSAARGGALQIQARTQQDGNVLRGRLTPQCDPNPVGQVRVPTIRQRRSRRERSGGKGLVQPQMVGGTPLLAQAVRPVSQHHRGDPQARDCFRVPKVFPRQEGSFLLQGHGIQQALDFRVNAGRGFNHRVVPLRVGRARPPVVSVSHLVGATACGNRVCRLRRFLAASGGRGR